MLFEVTRAIKRWSGRSPITKCQRWSRWYTTSMSKTPADSDNVSGSRETGIAGGASRAYVRLRGLQEIGVLGRACRSVHRACRFHAHVSDRAEPAESAAAVLVHRHHGGRHGVCRHDGRHRPLRRLHSHAHQHRDRACFAGGISRFPSRSSSDWRRAQRVASSMAHWPFSCAFP